MKPTTSTLGNHKRLFTFGPNTLTQRNVRNPAYRQLTASLSSKLSRASHYLLFPLLASIQVLINTQAQAQTNVEQESRWYEVEVVVFARSQEPGTASELWRSDIQLSYPSNWVELLGLPEQEPALEAFGQGASVTNDTIGEALDDTTNPETPNIEGTNTPTFDPIRDIAFHVLPSEELQLKDQAKRIGRRHQVLFHQAWRQPFIRNDEETPSILIFGGDRYDQHNELEGSIKINYRRWLHVETNLWLTWFARNYGQETENWPELPLRPYPRKIGFSSTGNSSTISAGSPEINNDVADSAVDENATSRNGTTADVLTLNGELTTGLSWSNDDNWQFQPLTSQYDSILDKPYVAEHMVLMQETRKVDRSGEIHYIDHPQLGILVHFTRYEPPEPESLEDTEAQEQLNQILDIPF